MSNSGVLKLYNDNTSFELSNNIKCVIKYGASGFNCYVNGVELSLSTNLSWDSDANIFNNLSMSSYGVLHLSTEESDK